MSPVKIVLTFVVIFIVCLLIAIYSSRRPKI